MKQYIEEVDALHASETLRQSIADLPRQAAKKKPNAKRFVSIAAVIAVVLIACVIGVPSVFLATRKSGSSADYMPSAEEEYVYTNQRLSYSDDDRVFLDGNEEDAKAAFTSSTAENSSMPAELPAGRKFIRSAYSSERDLLYQAVGDPREFGRRNAEFARGGGTPINR